MEKRLGKIEKVSFGLGGYQDCCIGIHFTFCGDGWGVGTTKSSWNPEIIKHSETTKWSEAEREADFSDIIKFTSKLLKQAKVDCVDKLKNIPVEVTFEGNSLRDWRILTEVI